MTLIRSIFSVLVFSGLASVASAQNAKSAGERTPFIERIGVPDYLAVQKSFPEPYSQNNDLVVLQTVDGSPYRSVLLKKDARGKYAVELWSLDDTLPTDPVPLETEVARQVMRAFELKLYRFVLMGTGKHVAKGRSEAWWFFHRNRNNMASAGLIIKDAAYDNPEAETLLKDLIGGLVNYASVPESGRSELSVAIDKAATELVLLNEP